MNKFEELIAATKLGELMNKKEEELKVLKNRKEDFDYG